MMVRVSWQSLGERSRSILAAGKEMYVRRQEDGLTLQELANSLADKLQSEVATLRGSYRSSEFATTSNLQATAKIRHLEYALFLESFHTCGVIEAGTECLLCAPPKQK